MEIIMEIFLEGYMELMLLIVPTKGRTKGAKLFAAILAIAATLGCMALFLFGAYLMSSEQVGRGALCILLSIFISLAQIIAGYRLWKKRD